MPFSAAVLRALSCVLVSAAAVAVARVVGGNARRTRVRGRRTVGSALPQVGGCVYLDYAATCPIYPDVADAILPFLYEHWGNPSSGHAYGAPSKIAIDLARERLRKLVNADSASEVVFCSCGSEADNWAISGALKPGRNHVVVSSIEHPAVLACVEALRKEGRCSFTVVGCDSSGIVDPADVARAVRPGTTAVVSIMLANNEVGSVMDLRAISDAVRAVDANVLIHTDAAQAVGKIDVDVEALQVDLLTIVGHKFGAPKGVAALYARHGRAELSPLFFGGGQEGGRRAGTEAVPSIVALGEAAQIWLEQGPTIAAHSTRLRDRLRAALEARLDDTSVNGPLSDKTLPPDRALPNVLSFAVRGIRASDVLFDLKDVVAASASAACHAGSTSVSAVLRAVGVEEALAVGTLRLSVGRHTTEAEVDRAAKLICDRILAPKALV
ncbi:pyridoxal phosphate-dependent transferase [Pelagophyceae sp. CCMP2097]|nr:pyridoxal phosphate-dependent transferase [Pelagophyceae sp. CCMP2097]|mmetsp:Transcript_27662/g.92927  ORF Transcript_27662/g.92927 Transcript_27662/m.92927 type:complete len:440 (+) Transcript_27662:33-1352(+)|eukprot:CAMPEP_0184224302 /NCGR_PEP_ID=MMETSP0976-20121227/19676_1 /TAXON_ID=483370 /ORGANISM="non described non described, Strain CCMP2097" /LENGTH=439 /DNA_ID=CAMNT_0026529235 /DNA_START=37 /DNA_END=1356 /DNA_ORIENTATION=-